MWREFAPAFRLTLLFTLLTGVLYPGLITGLCQLFFPNAANGSLISVNGRLAGSILIGQKFSRPEYFQPRPSAAGYDGYDASTSGGSNYGPTNQKLIGRVTASIGEFRKANPNHSGRIPADLLTASASGLDPHISPASATAQAVRIAKARNVSVDRIEQIILENTEPRQLGFLGEPRVNVLKLNIALDEVLPQSSVVTQR
jgi:K+-transporting ATPase ATPase C chain